MLFFNPSTIIFNSKIVQKFISLYAGKDNWHNLDKSKANMGYGFIHYSLIRSTKPKSILCIGSKLGYIPASCALACRDNKFGTVDFVDANYDSNDEKYVKNHWGGIGFWTKERAKKHFGEFNLNKYITLYPMTTAQFKKENKNKKWDYIYLDGDHSYEGAKKDYSFFWPSLNKNGYLLMHDIYTDEKKNPELGDFKYGVHRLWRELKKKHKRVITFEGEYGLGLIQKS